MGLLWSIWLGAGGCTSAGDPNGETTLHHQKCLQLGLKTDKRRQVGEKSPSPQLQLIIWGRNGWLWDAAVSAGGCSSMKGLVMPHAMVTYITCPGGSLLPGDHRASASPSPLLRWVRAEASQTRCRDPHWCCFGCGDLSSPSLCWDGQSLRNFLVCSQGWPCWFTARSCCWTSQPLI